MKTYGLVEKSDDLNKYLEENLPSENSECILRVFDNKSDVLLETVVVKHPVIFIRSIQDFCKSFNLPVSDVSVAFVGFISDDSKLYEVDDIFELSPYIYFQKAEDVNSSEGKN